MMQLGRKATPLVALSLLVSAATARAKCAWVLWTETNQQLLRPDAAASRTIEKYPMWEFDTNVHMTRDACEQALSREMKSAVASFSRAGRDCGSPPKRFLTLPSGLVSAR